MRRMPPIFPFFICDENDQTLLSGFIYARSHVRALDIFAARQRELGAKYRLGSTYLADHPISS